MVQNYIVNSYDIHIFEQSSQVMWALASKTHLFHLSPYRKQMHEMSLWLIYILFGWLVDEMIKLYKEGKHCCVKGLILSENTVFYSKNKKSHNISAPKQISVL